jgi:hypothetical protein
MRNGEGLSTTQRDQDAVLLLRRRTADLPEGEIAGGDAIRLPTY